MEMDVYARRRLVALGVIAGFIVLIILMLKSCGGDDDPSDLSAAGSTTLESTVLTTDEWIAEADAICDQTNAAVGGLSTDDAVAYSDERFRLAVAEHTALQELGEPAEPNSDQQAFMTAMRQLQAGLKDVKDYTAAGDTVNLPTAQTAVSTAESEATTAAKDYGMESCATFDDVDTTDTSATGSDTGVTPVTPTTTTPVTPVTPAPTDTGTPPPTDDTGSSDGNSGGIVP